MNSVLSRAVSRALVPAALAVLALSAPASASARGGAYSATLATATAEPKRGIIGDTLWKCQGDSCTAPYDGSHPVRTCAAVARKFGPVAAFATPRGALSAEQLAECNATD